MLEFLSLPNEVILEITDNLPLHDISALLKTNHRLSDLLTTALLTQLFHSRSLTHGRRLLNQLASRQDLIRVKNLIARGILNFTEPETLLHEVVKSESVQALQTLLHFGLNPDKSDSKHRTPLSLAAKLGRVDCASVLAARRDVRLDWPNYKYRTPLMLAVRGGQEEIVRILVQAREDDPLRFGHTTGRRCFHLAARGGHVPILRFLLDYVDPNEDDGFGSTALHHVVRDGDWFAVECLLAHERVNANTQDCNGQAMLHTAVVWKQDEIAKLLLSHPRVEINLVDRQGQTPLHLAVDRSNIEIARLLLSSSRLDVNLLDTTPGGNAALHIAIIRRSLEIVQLFVEHIGLDINLPNRRGERPVELAGQIFYPLSDIEFLLQHPDIDLTLGPSLVEEALDIVERGRMRRWGRVLAYIQKLRSAAGDAGDG